MYSIQQRLICLHNLFTNNKYWVFTYSVDSLNLTSTRDGSTFSPDESSASATLYVRYVTSAVRYVFEEASVERTQFWTGGLYEC